MNWHEKQDYIMKQVQKAHVMRVSEQEIEQRLKDKGLTKNRISPEVLDKIIVDKQFYRFPNTNSVVCCLTTANGFTVIGHAGCVSPENFDEEIGQDIAFRNARNQLWPLLGYALAEAIHRERTADAELDKFKSDKSDPKPPTQVVGAAGFDDFDAGEG